jgi:predicted acyltransferase
MSVSGYTSTLANAKYRDQSLDALRGYAILTMILSGAIAYGGVLPAWMYHAQVPPPLHQFVPTIAGITWVDLVFPFFLFSMGAAIPLSLSKLKDASFGAIAWIAFRRFLLLVFFAFFTEQMRAWVLSESPTLTDYLLSLAAFLLLFFQFYTPKGGKHERLFVIIKVAAFVAGGLMMYFLPLDQSPGFKTGKVDIIILVLANMAFFGTIVWWLTRRRPVLRIGLLAFVMAVFLGSKEAGSWNEWLYNLTPAAWIYKFYFLKYLFIIIPGTIAGDWLLQHRGQNSQRGDADRLTAVICTALIVLNVVLLFSRWLVVNLFVSIALLFVLRSVIRKQHDSLCSKFFEAGAYLLLLGLTFEAYEGGIKKDFSTYSYYFVTCGLAFFLLITFNALQSTLFGSTVVKYLGLNGRNPMVAYVAGNLLLTPILHITGGSKILDMMNGNALAGFLKGLIFTAIVSIITIYFTKRKWFWKT